MCTYSRILELLSLAKNFELSIAFLLILLQLLRICTVVANQDCHSHLTDLQIQNGRFDLSRGEGLSLLLIFDTKSRVKIKRAKKFSIFYFESFFLSCQLDLKKVQLEKFWALLIL